MPAIRKVLNSGKAKAAPFTICIVANPWLENLLGSNAFKADPIMARQADFDTAAQFVADSILGRIHGQAENLFDDPEMLAAARVVSIFETGLPSGSANSLVADDSNSLDQLIARRTVFRAFATRAGESMDVGIAVSASIDRNRATTWFANDDETSPGDTFVLDGVSRFHRSRVITPGTVAIHVTERSITALHEFQHAIGSYENGAIVDLYRDSVVNVNCKRQHPIPPTFGNYQTVTHLSDLTRDHLGYETGWTSFHCALIDPAFPALMDNYRRTATPALCRNDTITRQFVIDRIRARMKR